MPAERVTVTMPGQVVEEIDRMERNRSAFVLEAVRNEIKRRRRKAVEDRRERGDHIRSREVPRDLYGDTQDVERDPVLVR